MKSTDYMVIQAPMILDLHLKGYPLLLFALITGFTKDQKTRFRGSLTYMMDWLDTNKQTVLRALKTLEESGLIERHPAMIGNIQVNEYSSRYNEVLEALRPGSVEVIERGNKMLPVTKCDPSEGGNINQSQNVTDRSQNVTKGVTKCYQTGHKMLPNNIDNNIYNNISYSYCELTPQEQEEEKKGLFELFFWKNAVNPSEEVERFIGHNTANGWQNRDGRPYDTAAKRHGLAQLWKFQLGEDRTSDLFLHFWRQVWRAAAEHLLPGSSVLLDTTAKIQQNESQVILYCRRNTADFIEQNIPVFKPAFQSLLQGRNLTYQFTTK